jgi:hypothetical protein
MLQLTPAAGHTHCAQLDAAGNGGTTASGGHSHQVIGFQVQPMAGHTHQVTPTQCQGAAKPCNCGRK